MKNYLHSGHKILGREELDRQLLRWRLLGQSIVFTNGVFDILHKGHIESLDRAASFGDVLIVGVNSDASTGRLKPGRPVNGQADRMTLLAALEVVDAVVLFEEDTPLELIKAVRPDVLVKGGDYRIDQIVGAPEVQGWGGRVEIITYEHGYSTTGLIERIHSL
jgi:D-beta-D-heptose 7-phosphate kinase/D-beta-D-heptose 1-phosphate adenosyltransferase